MSLLQKISSALRGKTRELGEAIVDANQLLILEQEIFDAKQSLEQAKHDLSDLMAKEIQAQRKIKSIEADISEHEQLVQQSIDKSNETLALEIAEYIRQKEVELAQQQVLLKDLVTYVAQLKQTIQESSDIVNQMEQKCVKFKATAKLQDANASITNQQLKSSHQLSQAQKSIERLEQKQTDTFDRMEAMKSLQSDHKLTSLKEKIAQAGLSTSEPSAQEILERLKAKNKAS